MVIEPERGEEAIGNAGQFGEKLKRLKTNWMGIVEPQK